MNLERVARIGLLVIAMAGWGSGWCPAAKPGDAPRAPARAIPVAVSQDGSLALLTSAGHDGLVLVDTASGCSTAVSDGRKSGYYASISPDNRYVCFKAFKDSPNGRLQAPCLYNIAEKRTIALTSWAHVTGTPEVAPDGTIAFTEGSTLIVLGSDLAVRGRYSLGHDVNLVAFAPDSSAIAYNNADEQIVVLDLATGDQTMVTDGRGAYWGPAFSPDGAKVLVRGVAGEVACANRAGGMNVLAVGDVAGWADSDTIAFVGKVTSDSEVTQTDFLLLDVSGVKKAQSVLELGDAAVVVSPGAIVSAQGGKMKFGKVSHGGPAWTKDLPIPCGLGGAAADGAAATEGVIQSGNVVEITGVPYINQVYDTLDNFCGSWACNATAALMCLQYYNILPAEPRNVSWPYPHVSNFGFYISEIYTFNGHTYDVKSQDCAHKWKYGGYGYIVQNNWEDTKTHMAEYISYHGPSSAVDWSPTFGKAQAEIPTGCPFVLLNSLTSAGHYITCIGYCTDQYTLVFNDPYGNKNLGTYPNFEGTRVFYDWPGYSYGNENLNTVWCYIWARMNQGPTPTPTVAPTPSPSPTPGTDVIVDNDSGAPAYTETGTWLTSTSTGYNGGSYRYATAGSASTATWTGALSTTGQYEVFVFYRAGTNRPTAAKYDIYASDGTHTVYINQQINDMVWVSLGTFPFNAGDNQLRVDALGSTPSGNAVIADAVRFTLNSAPTPTPSPTPSATPTPTPIPIDMYVNDIAMGSGVSGRNYYATATIWIKDVQGGNVSGATVSYQWSGAVSQTGSGTTGADGKVTVQSPNKRNGGTFTITITNVTASGYTYNPALNVETSDSITAP